MFYFQGWLGVFGKGKCSNVTSDLVSYHAPINVKPLGEGGGRPGIGRGFDVTSLPVTGTLDHSLSSGGWTFDFNCQKSGVHRCHLD